jgi:outer membrane protein OmpA-like peptidoglycan-associated protein
MTRQKTTLFLMLMGSAVSMATLSGCASMPWDEGYDTSSTTTQTSSAMSMPATERADMAVATSDPSDIERLPLDQAPGVQEIPQFPTPTDRDLKVMTNKLSGGSVEIYGLDIDPPPSINRTMAGPVGMPMAIDPRVTVYPLDDFSQDSIYSNNMDSQTSVTPSWPNAYLPTDPNNIDRLRPGSVYPPMPTPSTQPATTKGVPLSDASSDMLFGHKNAWGEYASVMTDSGANIFFGYGSDALDAADMEVIYGLTSHQALDAAPMILIEGYASSKSDSKDPIRARFLNLKESMNRAFAVSRALIEKGIPADKITTIGRGDTCTAGQGEAADRRVDVVAAQSGS